MTTDIDIYRAANLLMQQHGAWKAEIEAAQRADAFLESGNLDGQSNICGTDAMDTSHSMTSRHAQ